MSLTCVSLRSSGSFTITNDHFHFIAEIRVGNFNFFKLNNKTYLLKYLFYISASLTEKPLPVNQLFV